MKTEIQLIGKKNKVKLYSKEEFQKLFEKPKTNFCSKCGSKVTDWITLKGKKFCWKCSNQFFDFLKRNTRKCSLCGKYKEVHYSDYIGSFPIVQLCFDCCKELKHRI